MPFFEQYILKKIQIGRRRVQKYLCFIIIIYMHTYIKKSVPLLQPQPFKTQEPPPHNLCWTTSGFKSDSTNQLHLPWLQQGKKKKKRKRDACYFEIKNIYMYIWKNCCCPAGYQSISMISTLTIQQWCSPYQLPVSWLAGSL